MRIAPSLVPVRIASLNASIELRPAVGIARTILLHCPDIDARAPNTSAQLVAAERKCALRNGTYVTGISAPISGPASGTSSFSSVKADPQSRERTACGTSAGSECPAGRKSPKRLLLALLGPLAIADVQRRRALRPVIANRQRRANGRIHAAAEHDDAAFVLARSPWLNALQRRLPDELVDLKSQAHIQIVRQNPFRHVPRINHAVVGAAAAGRILAKRRRKNNRGAQCCEAPPG